MASKMVVDWSGTFEIEKLGDKGFFKLQYMGGDLWIPPGGGDILKGAERTECKRVVFDAELKKFGKDPSLSVVKLTKVE